MNQVTVRVYGPLNDFLAPAQRQTAVTVRFDGGRSTKDLVESLGVPHPEIELLLVNGEPAPFERLVQDGDRVAVFPRFRTLDVSAVTRPTPDPAARMAFVVDGHLGTLARRLRLLGLDVLYSADPADDDLATLAARDERILLTRDRALLMRRVVSRGHWVREADPGRQVIEILRHFGPLDLRPFTRCLRCNADLREVPKSAIESSLPPLSRAHYDRFQECSGCGRVYWRGAHWKRLVESVQRALEAVDGGALSSAGHSDRR